MKNFKERFLAFQSPYNERSREERMEAWSAADQHTEKMPRAIPLAIAEFAELITVLEEYYTRPDKGVDKYDVLDELADVWYFIDILRRQFGFTAEEIQKAADLKMSVPIPGHLADGQQ